MFCEYLGAVNLDILIIARTIPLAIIRLCFLYTVPPSSLDYTFISLNTALLTSLHAILAVFAAAVPFSKQFVDSLVAMPYQIGDESHHGSRSGGSLSLKERYLRNSSTRTKRSLPNPVSLLTSRGTEYGNSTRVSASQSGPLELGTYGSREGSRERMVIHQTRSATVTSQPSSDVVCVTTSDVKPS